MTVTDEVIEESWKNIRKKFHHPPLDTPTINKKMPTATINMETHEVEFNPKFAEELVSDELTLEETLEAIFGHEIGHWHQHPFDLKTMLLETNELKNNPKSSIILALYRDVKDNLNIDVRGHVNKLDVLYKNMKITKQKNKIPLVKVDEVIGALYSEITKKDFGFKKNDLPKELQEKVDQLLTEVNFFSKKSDENLYYLNKFASILEDIIDEPPKMCIDAPTSLKDFPTKDIMREIKKLIDEGKLSKKDLKKLAEKIGKEIPDFAKKAGLEGGSENYADILYYKTKSRNFNIRIRGIPLINDGCKYPSQHRDFTIDDSPQRVDVFTSYGKYLPGISNVWIDDSFEVHGEKEDVPDVVIMLDSSGSMTNPIQRESIAVLAAFAAARSYFFNGAKVAVANFSGKTVTLPFTANQEEVWKQLVLYQGGGTTVNIEKIKKLAEKHDKRIDYLIITDTEISNVTSTLEFLNKEADKGNRSFVFCIQRGVNADYQKKYSKVNFPKVYNRKDLAKIVIESTK